MLTVRPADDYAVVTASGEFDMANAASLRRCLAEVIDSGRRHLMLDAANVTFLDATTLGVLVGARNRLIGLGGDLILIHISALTRRILRITALDEAFAIRRTLAEALTELHGVPPCGPAPNGTGTGTGARWDNDTAP